MQPNDEELRAVYEEGWSAALDRIRAERASGIPYVAHTAGLRAVLERFGSARG